MRNEFRKPREGTRKTGKNHKCNCHPELYKANRRAEAMRVSLYASAKPLAVSGSHPFLGQIKRICTYIMRCRIQFGMTPSFFTKETKTKPLQFCNSARFRWFPIKAFTLAETLITLAIIGVVAALTIPNLMRNYERAKLEAQFKHAYKFLSQGIERAYGDNGEDLIPSEIKTATNPVTNGQTALSYIATNYWGGLSNKPITTKNFMQYDGTTSSAVLGCGLTDVRLVLKNGMHIFSRSGCSRYPIEIAPDIWLTAIIVDVNGNKKPNRWGYDIWSFNIDKINRKLVIDGAPKYNEVGHGHNTPYKCGSKGKAKFNEDYGCAYYAIINRCPEDESQTYWQCIKM